MLTHNILVFIWSDHIVPIDAGNGPMAGGQLINHLRTAGIASETVTDIVLTHAHPDHIGGLGQFPAATVHISREEYEFWQSDSPDFSKSQNTDECTAKD